MIIGKGCDTTGEGAVVASGWVTSRTDGGVVVPPEVCGF
jgi:hypothetical protein